MQFDQIKRRDFISLLGGAAAWPLAARAQQSERMRRIGFLRASPPPERELKAFVQGLAEQGHVQGRNFVLVAKWGDGTVARLPELAVELVNSGVDLIVTDGGSTTRAVHALTSTIPIVMASSADPLWVGAVQSLSRPGGNVTGLTSLAAGISGKVFEIFKELIPGLSNLAIVAPRLIWDIFAASQSEAAKMLSIKLSYFDLPGPDAINMALDQAKGAGAQGAILRGTPFFSLTQLRMIVEAAAEHRLPVMYETREYVQEGGLLSYAADRVLLYRRAANYVAKILAGANPGELPIEQPTKFELVINLKTARALGLEVSPKLLALADEVTE
jgi:putative tryptophan/tyrosine transport system substrate-binding protein